MTRRSRGWLLALVALATGLRLYGLGTWSLDGDELYSWYDCQALWNDAPGAAWPEGVRAYPLGYLAMAVAVKLGGLSEFSIRLVPALAGSAAVWVLATLRRDVLWPDVSLGAALVAALSPWLIYHSQTARFYAPLLLLAALAVLWSLPGPGRRPVASLAAALAAVGCHPTALLLLPGLAVATWLAAPTPALGRRRLVAGGLVVGALGAVVLALPGASLGDVLEGALEPSGGAAYDARRFGLGLAYNLGPLVGLAALLGAWSAWKQGGREWRALVWSGLLPPAILLSAALLGVSTHQRYAMVAVPALLLLGAWGWRRLSAVRPRWGLALAAGVLLLPLPALAAHYDHGNRHDWRSAAGWLAELANPGDIILADEHATFELYLQPDPDFAPWIMEEAPLDPAKYASFLGNKRDVWVVLKSSRMQGVYGAGFDAWVAQHFVERARIGAAPPPLVRHDNRLVLLQRRERVLEPLR